jgi:hypothetical protein
VKLYGLDIETHDPHLTDKGVSWVYGDGEILVVGLYNAQTGVKRAFDGNGGKVIKKLLLDAQVTLVGANFVYDLGWLCYEHGLAAREVKCGLVDIAIAEASIDEYQQYSLDALAWKYLHERKGAENLKLIAESQGMHGDFRKRLKKLWDMGYQDEIREYVVSDADQPVRIWEKQREILSGKVVVDKENFAGCMDALITNFKLIKIILGMKQRGVRIDMAKRRKNYELLKGVQDKLQGAFERKYGRVNFNSSKQLAALFDREHVPYRCRIRIKGQHVGCYGSSTFKGSELWDERKRLKETFNGVRVQKGQLVLYISKQYARRTNDELAGMGYVTHMRLLRDKQPVKSRQPFSLRVGAQGCNMMYIFKQFREGDCLKEYMFHYDQHKQLFTPQRPLFILSTFL